MTKQEKIQEAYGKFYDEMNLWIDENGWFNKNAFYQEEFKFKYQDLDMFFSHLGDFMIPESIIGITNNNGWIKIESEEDLPKNNGSYFTKTNYCKETIERDYPIFTKSMSIEDERKWWLENITHYQPIVKPNEPLY